MLLICFVVNVTTDKFITFILYNTFFLEVGRQSAFSPLWIWLQPKTRWTLFFYIKKQQKNPVPNGFKTESLPWAYCDIAMQSENKVKKAALV